MNGSHTEFNLLLMKFEDSMYNRDVSSFHFKHNNLTNPYWLFLIVCQKQQISTMESWLHTATI